MQTNSMYEIIFSKFTHTYHIHTDEDLRNYNCKAIIQMLQVRKNIKRNDLRNLSFKDIHI